MTLARSITSFPHKIVLYQAINLVNGKRYIGITKTGMAKRVGRHFRTARLYKKGSAIGAAIRKYGQKNIQFRPLVVCPTWEYAKAMEIAAIASLKPEYNLTAGGDGASGYRHTEEHKAYMSSKLAGAKHFLGKSHSDETKERMRLSALKRISGPNRPVLLVDFDVTYRTLTAAAEALGYTKSSVYQAIKFGRRLNGTRVRYSNIGQGS